MPLSISLNNNLMAKSIFLKVLFLLFILPACTEKSVHLHKIWVSPEKITPRKTGPIYTNSYIVRTTSIPVYTTVSVTCDGEATVNTGMQLVLGKLNLPVTEMAGWPGKTAMELLHPDSHIKKQSFTAHVGDQEIRIDLSIVSLDFLTDIVDSSRSDEELVITVDQAGKKLSLKLKDDLKQPGNKYSQTGSVGIKVAGKLENGKSAEQIVYMQYGTVEFTSEEFKKMKWSF